MNLKNKVIVLTGASKGIGRVTVQKLIQYETKLALVSRKKEDLEKIKKEFGIKDNDVILIEASIAEEKDCKKIISEAVNKFGTIDILLNNAAQFNRDKIMDLKVGDFDRVWQTNIRGVFMLTKLALPYMIEKKEGTILNVSSTSGKRGYPGGAAYAASKFALNGFTECLLKEAREYNIRVLTISPSMVDTRVKPITEQKESGKGVYMRAEDVADSIISALLLPQRTLVKDIELWGTNP